MSEYHVYLCVSGVGISLFNKAVGDSVELPSGLERECIKSMEWKYKEMVIAEFDGNVSLPKSQFEGRLEMNDSNLSLIIRELSLQDSGEFLISANKGGQIKQRRPDSNQDHPSSSPWSAVSCYFKVLSCIVFLLKVWST